MGEEVEVRVRKVQITICDSLTILIFGFTFHAQMSERLFDHFRNLKMPLFRRRRAG